MKRHISFFTIALFLFGGIVEIFAQHDHEFSVYGGGGLSSLIYKTTIGDPKLGLGGHFGLGYQFFFTPNWGVGTGVEIACYNARFKMNNLDIRYMTTDGDGDRFEFRSLVNSYKEKQRATMLQIPLMLQFQTNKPDSKRQFFVAAGGKAGFPMKGKFSNDASFKNAGYYEYENSLYDTQEFMGFGNFPNRKEKGGLDFKTAFLLSAEAGIKWKLNDKWSLYTGLYLDYGLNNIKEATTSLPFHVEYNRNDPPEFSTGSIFQSQYAQSGGAPQSFTEKITPIAAGIKLRLTFGKDCKKDDKPATQVTPAPTPITDVKEEEPEIVDEEPIVEEEPVIEEKPVVEKEPIVKEEPKIDKNVPDAVKRQIERPIDNYVISNTDVASYQSQRLDEKIALLQQYPNSRFYIYGHTCDLGTDAVNERIGLGRATHAKAYMISKGIDESRILGIASKRDTEPVVPNSSEENRRKNRRVEIILE